MVTCGVKHVKFWSMQGSNLTCKKGILKPGKSQDFLSHAWLHNGNETRVVIGCASGDLYTFKGNTVESITKAHEGAVYALCTASHGYIVSGGKDGVVKVKKLPLKFECSSLIRLCL